MKKSSIQPSGPRCTKFISLSLDRRPSAGLAAIVLLASAVAAHGQTATSAQDTSAQTPAATSPTDTAPSATQPLPTVNMTNQPAGKTRKQDKVVPSKDTVQADKKYKKDNPLQGVDAKLPDKMLYDKAEDAVKHGRFDVARLDLQTLLNTYPDSQFQMRAKLAIADSWYKEGGTAALTQAEQEYRDFITFFPNQPEAAEAQMRIGDIYFREMDKPDRDNSKAKLAEENYRLMLQQFPESPRIPEAAQRLREVQESLAGADADVAGFYATRQNWAAAIARYQTVADTYPLFSHMDDVLVGLGDAYEAEAHYYRTLKAPLPEAARTRLIKIYDDRAASAYRKVVLEHSAAAHVEDARDRLAAMGLPIPTPTPEQVAASEALENSRGHYTLSNRAVLLVMHTPDTVPAATKGDPPLVDPKPVLAPTITAQVMEDFKTALNPAAASASATSSGTTPAPQNAPANTPAAAPAPAAPAALSFQDVPQAQGAAPGPAITATPDPSVAPSSSGGGMGIQIVQPSSNPIAAPPPGTSPTAFPGSTPAQSPAPAAIDPALKITSPNATEPLPPVEKPAPAPDAVNEIAPGTVQPAAQAPGANGKSTKAPCDTKQESCSNHKKKGLAKLNPF